MYVWEKKILLFRLGIPDPRISDHFHLWMYLPVKLEKEFHHNESLVLNGVIIKDYHLICIWKKTKSYHCSFWNPTWKCLFVICPDHFLLNKEKSLRWNISNWLYNEKKIFGWSGFEGKKTLPIPEMKFRRWNLRRFLYNPCNNAV